MAPNNIPGVNNQLSIPYRGRGDVVFGKHINPLIAVANALLKGTVVHAGSASGFLWSDHKLLLQIKNTLGGDSGAGMAYRGEYDNNAHNSDPLSPAYFVGDVVTVSLGNSVFLPTSGAGDSPQNARPGTYVCIKENTPLTDSTIITPVWPQYPPPPIEKRFWELIGGLNHFRGNYQADPHVSNTFRPDIIDRGFGAPDYMVGDIVQVDPKSDFASAVTVPGTYICVADQPSPAEFPVHTLVPKLGPVFDYPGRSSWVLLSTWPSTDSCYPSVFVDAQDTTMIGET